MFKRPKLINFLEIKSKKDEVRLTLIALFSGVLNALILVILNNSAGKFDNPEIDIKLFILFVSCVVTFLFFKRYLTYYNTRLVQHAVFRFRARILKQLNEVKLLSYEEIGKSQILNTLSEKTEMISQGVNNLSEGIPAVVMLICSFIYMAYLSEMALWVSIVCVATAVFTLYYLVISIGKTMQQAMDKESEYLAYMVHVLEGFNELKINRKKLDDLYDNYMNKVSYQAMIKGTESDIANVNLQLYAQVYFYVLMMAIVFIVPQLSDMSVQTIMSITTVVLFILSPMMKVIGMMSSVARANVAIEFLTKIESKLIQSKEPYAPFETSMAQTRNHFEKIEFNNVTFSYPVAKDERKFSIGPFNLDINRGELLFIRGGNGSGKSTFMKLLTGLYAADSGYIVMDNHEVDRYFINEYRNYFAIIFSDFHLFDRLYGLDKCDVVTVQEYIELMKMTHKTRYQDGRFSTINLSTGQKKRLALIVTLMEDKSIYIFDEVAADQDPEFKQFFYETILHKLKSMGKTVIVITHDEKYFNYGDRLYVMDNGQLREEKQQE